MPGAGRDGEHRARAVLRIAHGDRLDREADLDALSVSVAVAGRPPAVILPIHFSVPPLPDVSGPSTTLRPGRPARCCGTRRCRARSHWAFPSTKRPYVAPRTQ